MRIEDADAVTGELLLQEDQRERFHGAEAVAARAILELSRLAVQTGDRAARDKAIVLASELIDLRGGGN